MSMRDNFPIFKNKERNGERFIYLDNAATTQKPQIMIDALSHFYTHDNANIYRGVYPLAERATELFEQARATVAHCIGASKEEVIWTKNATEGLNIVASWALNRLKRGDEILLTGYEHHANLLPWQRVADITGARLTFIPVLPDGSLDYTKLDELINRRVKLISCSAVSNVTGAHTDLTLLAERAAAVGAKIVVDASQLLAHERIDLAAQAIDALVFSAHKLYGPTGVGMLYMKQSLQEQTPPLQLGGGMVFDVDLHTARYAKGPHKFEAGTPPIADAIAAAAALQWFYAHDVQAIARQETALLAQAIDGLQNVSGIRIIGPIEQLHTKGHLVSFMHEELHAHDVAAFLGMHGIAVRAGHHCAQPLAKALSIGASVRLSLACYTQENDIDYCVEIIKKIKNIP